jgi:citrate synthase
MSQSSSRPTTSICRQTPEDVFVREKSLCRDLIGQVTFTEMIYFQIVGTPPTPAQTAVLDACLVTLMEHGLTPSVLATRLVYSSAPEALQAAVAAGILAVGSVFVGTVEGCAQLLARQIASEAGVDAEARAIAEEHRRAKLPIPGFGHPLHKPDDPRSERILEVSREHGLAADHVAALGALSKAVDAASGKHITINATGAVAAALGDAGVPVEILRGFAIVARSAGLVGHALEERRQPAMRAIWEAAEQAVRYESRGDTR